MVKKGVLYDLSEISGRSSVKNVSHWQLEYGGDIGCFRERRK